MSKTLHRGQDESTLNRPAAIVLALAGFSLGLLMVALTAVIAVPAVLVALLGSRAATRLKRGKRAGSRRPVVIDGEYEISRPRACEDAHPPSAMVKSETRDTMDTVQSKDDGQEPETQKERCG